MMVLMLVAGCTQMLDSPEDVANALMSIVLPQADVTTEPSPNQNAQIDATAEISVTALVSNTGTAGEADGPTPLNNAETLTNTASAVEAQPAPITQTAVVTEEVVSSEAVTATAQLSQTLSLTETQPADEDSVLTVGQLRARQLVVSLPPTTTVVVTGTQPVSATTASTATLSLTSTLATSDTATVAINTERAEEAPAPVLVTIVTDGSRLNVRSEPASDAPIVGKVPAEAVIEVLASTVDAQWFQVALDEEGAQGWIAAQFTQPVEPAPTVSPKEGATAVLAPAAVDASVEATSTLSSPSLTATPSSITGTNTLTGTIGLTDTVAATASLSLTEALQSRVTVAPTEPTAITQAANMNVRSGPGTGYAVATVAPAGTQYRILALNPEGDWYQVEIPDAEEPAWVYAPLVEAVGPLDSLSALSADQIPPAPEPVAAPVSAAASSAPPPAGGGFFGYGVQAHMLGGGIGEAVNATAEMGFNWMKQQVEWRIFEGSPGAVDFSELRRIVDAAGGRGINVLFSVVNAPPWAREPGFDPNVGGPPADPQSYANFVGRLAGEFCGSGLKAIEVWNEQNLHYEWGNKPLNPAEYMNLLRAAYGSIKAACPSMLVISGAPTPAGDAGSIARDDFAYLEGMYQNGLANFADGIGVHPSGYNVPPGVRHEDACAVIQGTGNQFNGPCDTPHHSWSFRSTMEGYRNIMVVYGDTNKRLWPTEFGWAAGGALHPAYAYANDNDFEEQAAWTVEAYQMMRNWGWVGPAFLWNLNFRVVADGTEKAQWGIVRNDYSPLPVYNALRNMGK